MENKLDNLFQRFKKKGFLPVEIPDLVKDALHLMKNSRDLTIKTIDQELEDLGWGLNIMDFATFELITALVEMPGFSDAGLHIHNGERDEYLMEHWMKLIERFEYKVMYHENSPFNLGG